MKARIKKTENTNIDFLILCKQLNDIHKKVKGLI